MSLDKEKGSAKRAELVELVENSLRQKVSHANHACKTSDLASRILDACCSIMPPEAPEISFDLIRLSPGGGRGGRTRKPGNIMLNMRKLLATVASGTLAVAGVMANPWTAPLAALVLWNEIYSGIEIEIQEREASVIWAMWLNANQDNEVPMDDLLSIVNRERSNYQRTPLSRQELEDSLFLLKRLRCIEETEVDKASWWLCEWVQVEFD